METWIYRAKRPGKTTFLKLLMGKYEYSGTISSNVSFEYFPYDVPDADSFVIDVIHEISRNAQDWKMARELSLLNVSDNLLYRSYSTLSKGEQTKALLAALFLKENSFLLIDEPTNHLDTEGRNTLSDYLKRKHGFILVSHDRVFLDNCIDHILVINKTSIEVENLLLEYKPTLLFVEHDSAFRKNIATKTIEL